MIDIIISQIQLAVFTPSVECQPWYNSHQNDGIIAMMFYVNGSYVIIKYEFVLTRQMIIVEWIIRVSSCT